MPREGVTGTVAVLPVVDVHHDCVSLSTIDFVLFELTAEFQENAKNTRIREFVALLVSNLGCTHVRCVDIDVKTIFADVFDSFTRPGEVRVLKTGWPELFRLDIPFESQRLRFLEERTAWTINPNLKSATKVLSVERDVCKVLDISEVGLRFGLSKSLHITVQKLQLTRNRYIPSGGSAYGTPKYATADAG